MNHSTQPGPAAMTEHDAAAYLSVSVSWLRNNRRSPVAPPHCRIGARTIRYRRESLDAWLAQQEVAA